MAHAASPRLGFLLGGLYLGGAIGFLVSAFVFAASDPTPPRLVAMHTVSGAVLVLSWLVLVTAAVLTILRGRRTDAFD